MAIIPTSHNLGMPKDCPTYTGMNCEAAEPPIATGHRGPAGRLGLLTECAKIYLG